SEDTYISIVSTLSAGFSLLHPDRMMPVKAIIAINMRFIFVPQFDKFGKLLVAAINMPIVPFKQ
ncbi:MAG: hypothetical protein KIG93_07705, partial [Prevotella sp.]|nr:hypothetical protein [Prevotella sp.]